VNVISNSCIGAQLYKLFNMEFNNPFMWNVITYDDFKKLIIKYDEIDFGNNNISLYNYPGDPISMVTFDNNIKLYYIHYHQTNKYSETKKIDIDVYSNDILSYTTDKVTNRIERMKKYKEDPIFIFETRPRPRFNANYNVNDVLDFINLQTRYKKIVVTSFDYFKNSNIEKQNNCSIVYYNDPHPELAPDVKSMSKLVYDKLYNEFV